ncbi:hypothetical protein AAGG74_18960 [Bacillus mexicanus]|uniref:hypothetical protein n=1 Tax=Bacillus mexicanus TaxID=2834415 RepID=UPI003D1B6B2A
MEINEIVSRLQSAHQHYEPIIRDRDVIIQEEVDLLLKFIEKIYPFTTKKKINGKDSVLIYIFPENDRDLISNDVYLSSDGYIVYQVYNKSAYLEIVPDAEIENGYVKTPIHYFLTYNPLIKILKFFQNRPSKLIDQATETDELNNKRKDLINLLNNVL